MDFVECFVHGDPCLLLKNVFVQITFDLLVAEARQILEIIDFL